MQLDLFLHSAEVTLRNAVIAALCARDAEAMRVAMDRLLAEFPNDLHNNDFEHLFSELSALSQDVVSASDIAQRIERIETRLRPLLQKMIGTDAAQHWIEPVYGQLARAAYGQAFTRSLVQAHAGGLFLRANEPAQARVAVVAIPSWRRIPEALAWMAEIALREDKPDEYWPLVAELAWIAPALLAGLLATEVHSAASATVLHYYRVFCSEAEADGETNELVWFPAWLLIEHAELLPRLRTTHQHDSRPARSAALLIDLLLGERRGLTPAVVDKRQQLRDLAPAIFTRYMARR
jgi:hypothetical protein